MTDGPFTESKEMVAGFAILKANSKDEAIELARNFLGIAGEGECELPQLYDPNLAEQNCELRAAKRFGESRWVA